MHDDVHVEPRAFAIQVGAAPGASVRRTHCDTQHDHSLIVAVH